MGFIRMYFPVAEKFHKNNAKNLISEFFLFFNSSIHELSLNVN